MSNPKFVNVPEKIHDNNMRKFDSGGVVHEIEPDDLFLYQVWIRRFFIRHILSEPTSTTTLKISNISNFVLSGSSWSVKIQRFLNASTQRAAAWGWTLATWIPFGVDKHSKDGSFRCFCQQFPSINCDLRGSLKPLVLPAGLTKNSGLCAFNLVWQNGTTRWGTSCERIH